MTRNLATAIAVTVAQVRMMMTRTRIAALGGLLLTLMMPGRIISGEQQVQACVDATMATTRWLMTFLDMSDASMTSTRTERIRSACPVA